MSPSLPVGQFVKSLVLVVVLSYFVGLDSSEAKNMGDISQDDIINFQRSIHQAQQELASAQQQQQQPMDGVGSSNLDRLDSDDDDEDDERVQLQSIGQTSAGAPVQVAGSDIYQTGQASYQPPLSAGDLGTAASKHHGHHHGAKGWLDMGAWTGKKGAFGWYDKHPVGKGK